MPSKHTNAISDDPDDEKPEDWVDEAKIADPKATKASYTIHVFVSGLRPDSGPVARRLG